MKYLIFGSNGFLGRNISDLLKKEGKDCIEVDREGKYKTDLNDQSQILDLLKKEKPDYIFQCAGCVENSEKAILVNPILTFNVLQALEEANLENLKKITIIGSSAEYGIVSKGEKADPLKGKNFYAISKILEVSVAERFREKKNFPLVVVHLFNPLGTGLLMGRFLVPNMIRQIEEIKKGERETMEVGRLDSKRDYIDVIDAAKIIVGITEKEINKYDNYDVGSGKSMTNGELIKILLELKNGSDIEIKETLEQPEPNFACKADISRIEEEIGKFNFTDLKETLRRIVNE